MRSVAGGLLAQTPDDRGVDEATWQVVTRRQPTEAERRSLAFAWLAAKHIKSNAIVFVQGTATVGVGAGQMNRVDSVYLAARRAGDRSIGAVMGSDAFFPFADGIEAAAAAGVTACIQPGGSLRDEEAIAAADRLGHGDGVYWRAALPTLSRARMPAARSKISARLIPASAYMAKMLSSGVSGGIVCDAARM